MFSRSLCIYSLIFSFLLLGAQSSLAASSFDSSTNLNISSNLICSRIFKTNQLESRVHIGEGVKSHFTISDYENFVEKIHDLLGSLEQPLTTKIKITDDPNIKGSHHNGYENYVSVTINLPKYKSGKNTHPKANLAILAHEYAHAIFEINRKLYSKKFDIYYSKYLESEREIKELPKRAKSLSLQINERTDEKTRKRLEAQIDMHEIEYKKHMKFIASNMDKLRMLKAIDELFADIVAVVTLKDPKAISEVAARVIAANLNKKSNSEVRSEIEEMHIYFRDFSDKPKALREWKRQMVLIHLSQDIYSAFLPSRWVFWDIVENHLDSDRYRLQVLPKVFRILNEVSEVIIDMPEDNFGVRGMSQIDFLNELIIKKFNADLD